MPKERVCSILEALDKNYYYKLVKTFHQRPRTQVLMWPPQFTENTFKAHTTIE